MSHYGGFDDFDTPWPNVAITREVQRGKMLREQKALPPPHYPKKVRIVDVSVKGPCDRIKSANKKRERKVKGPITPNSRYSRITECPPPAEYRKSERSGSPARSSTLSATSKKTMSMSKDKERCPLRIAELAEPTRRHCLATWRNSPDNLPEHMLDRLQQRIMNHGPVIQVDDAINLFQSRCKKKRPQKIQIRTEPTEEEMRYVAALFARNMAQKLMRRTMTNTCITSEHMRGLTQIVYYEISKLLEKREISAVKDTIANETIQYETALKIAVWIVSILQDAEERLLEEELRAKLTKERIQGREGRIRTLIENCLRSHNKEAGDLEEEEGPALDFIDQLIENVLAINQDKSSHDSEPRSNETLDNDSSINTRDSEASSVTKIAEDFVNQAIVKSINISESKTFSHSSTSENENFKTTDKGIIDISPSKVTSHISINVEQTDVNSYSSDRIERSDISSHVSIRMDKSNESSPGKSAHLHLGEEETVMKTNYNADESEFKDANFDNTDDVQTKDDSDPIKNDQFNSDHVNGTSDQFVSADELEVGDSNDEDLTAAVEEPQVSAITDVTEDDPAHDDRKVKFSSVDSGYEGLTPSSSAWFPQAGKKNGNATNTMRSDIIFAPPNHSLLSDADESWPGELSQTIGIKFSESVSKSVTSLGHIAEYGIGGVEQEYSSEEKASNSDTTDNDNKSSIKGSKKQQNENHSKKGRKSPPININVVIKPKPRKQVRENSSKITKPIKKDFEVISHTQEKDTAGNNDSVGTDTQKSESDDSMKQIQNKIDSMDEPKDRTCCTASPTNAMKRLFCARCTSPKEEWSIENERRNHRNVCVRKESRTKCMEPRTANLSSPINYKVPKSARSPAALRNKFQPPKTPHLIKQWCGDLHRTVDNLSRWHDWIDFVCDKLVTLKKESAKTENLPPNDKRRKQVIEDWETLKSGIRTEAALWKSLKERTIQGLNAYNSNSKAKAREITINDKFTDLCGDIDNLSLWTHRLIVSTEYCLKCKCKYYSKTKLNT